MKLQTTVLLALAVIPAAAQTLDGLTHVAFRVRDLDRSLAFYTKAGFEHAFDMRDNGRITVSFIKVNDRQFIELYPPQSADPAGFMHACFDSPDLEALHDDYARKGIKTSDVRKAGAGNLLFTMPGPESQVVEFLQYLPGSLHSEDRGKHLGPRRPSSSLLRVTAALRDPVAGRSFYQNLLGNSAYHIDTSASRNALTFALDDPNARATSVTDPDGVVLSFVPKWVSVADRLVTTRPESYPFNWGEGVQMMGLMKAGRLERDPRYFDYTEKWAALYEGKDLDALLRAVRPGYCGHWSPASAILYLHQERPKPDHMALVQGVADFIAKRAERSPEGALGHFENSHQLWVDTLFMACPLLAGLGKTDDAANQIILHARHLQDEKTGLFRHMWDWRTGTQSEGYWGRGNGWVLMSLADTMEAMKKNDPKYAELSAIARKLASGIEATQNNAGTWHTVLDDPATYPESSASAMFTYGFLKLARLGVLPASVRTPALKAWRAVNDSYVRDGEVVGASAGTDPRGRDAYGRIAVGRQTWGTGAYLLAASEAVR